MAWSLQDYDEIQEIGTGSTGLVILSRDRATGMLVAVKYLSKRIYHSAGFAESFRGTARALTEIENKHIALMYEYVEGPDSAAVVMELIDGVSLRRVIDYGGAVDPLTALFVIRGALLGLDDIHGHGITHRDIRPQNLLIDARGVVKVVDTGIPAHLRGRAPATGHPRYLAPEVAAGPSPSPASDIYACAVTLLECLTGATPPVPGDKALRRDGRIGAGETAALRAAGVPETVQSLLGRELATDPAERSAGAAALIEALDQAARTAYGAGWLKAGEASLGRRLSPVLLAGRGDATETVATGGRQHRRIALILAAALLLIVGIGVFAVAGGLFGPGAGTPANAGPGPASTHTAAATPGPAVPTPAPSHPGQDTTKPDQPTGLTVIGRALTEITLTWNPSHDNVKVAGYIITRDSSRAGTTYVPGFTSSGLTANTSYTFSVTAFDAAGNLSTSSPTITATTLAQPDLTPPAAPTHLHSTGQSRTTIALAWTPAHDNIGIAGYDVFRGSTRIGSVTSPYFTDSGLTESTSYSYTVRAYDTSNNTSANSAEVAVATWAAPDTTSPSSATPPSPTPATSSPPSVTSPPPVVKPTSTPAPQIHVVIKITQRPAPLCTTKVEADITVTGGLLDVGNVHLTYTVNGVTSSTTVLIDIDYITTPVVLDNAAPGGTGGAATVTVTSPGGGPPVSSTWDPTAGCAAG